MCTLGLSPHARGNRRLGYFNAKFDGPIPACAGEPEQQPSKLLVAGPIPACAGEPLHQSLNSPFLGAYPRMRGGTAVAGAGAGAVAGLSPHARGNRGGDYLLEIRIGPIPACAGEPGYFAESQDHSGAYPRMRGGTRLFHVPSSWAEGLSPHARGNHEQIVLSCLSPGPIPACAGEPLTA